MPTASRPTFMRRFAAPWRPPTGPDLGDMGTAFALDHSLDPPDVAGEEGNAPTHPGSIRTVAPWRLWLGRKLGS